MGAGGGDRKNPTTQSNEAHRYGGGANERMGKPRTAADKVSAGTLTRHTAGTDGARPEHSALARRKYGLLALEEPAGDPAVAGT